MKALALAKLTIMLVCYAGAAQVPRPANQSAVSRIWTADLGDGRYQNPVLFADYSDPDVIAVGDDYYLISSSFNMVPGLPILHSRDLVNWQIVGHVFTEQSPPEKFARPQHGLGAWAPSLRFHHGSFFVFYPDPDVGLLMTKSRSIMGPWSTPIVVKAAPGWIDPCPFWDDDGKAYMVNASAGSRRGVKSVVMVSHMAKDGTRLLGDAAIAVDGHGLDETLEGPKMYKRHGWYYIFAPAGGVVSGWQVVYRARNIFGPYERKVVLAQGRTEVNGPHQGAWVHTPMGEDWFLHFQDRGVYGRVVLLEPMHWSNDWPIIGINANEAGTGEPVSIYAKPKTRQRATLRTPADSDEFNSAQLGTQWQWQANEEPSWAFPSASLGALRLIAVAREQGQDVDLWQLPNVLTQKFPGPNFQATTKVTFESKSPGEETGLAILGRSEAYIDVASTASGLEVSVLERKDAQHDGHVEQSEKVPLSSATVYLRAVVHEPGEVVFSFSEDGLSFKELGKPFLAVQGQWIGATLGLFATGDAERRTEYGYADYDWFRFDLP